MTLPEGYTINDETPAIDDFRRLRKETGLSEKTQEAAERGLPNTWAGVVVRHEGHAIGMGRVIGDGGCHFQVVDMAVDRAHQGRGLGKAIFARLVAALEERAPDSAYVSLIADGDAKHLYAQFGFDPVMPASIGMARWIGGRPPKSA
ncbi:GNAT family N-acetyltransferase [Aureimonas mangrovi]|uniref:GNAT family N-acetyltransferase n=1 Tax=Aureimonas mangrovi TaxID=2758041 RepID=UPI00163D86C3|nr:GNAT family N-acetyltransferase [Aureimonas mangrovi]